MEQVGRPKKLPKNYQLVYDVVCAQPEGEHAAAGDIYASAKRLQSGIGYSTVYRALDRLRDLGLVLEVRVPGSASALYEAARSGHAHFRCDICGRISDIDYVFPAGEVAGVAARNRIVVADVTLTFNGSCEACQQGPDGGSRVRPASIGSTGRTGLESVDATSSHEVKVNCRAVKQGAEPP